MRALLLLLCLAGTGWAAKLQGVTLKGVTSDFVAVPAPDLTSQFLAVWRIETGSLGTNSQGDSTANLSVAGGNGADTTHVWQGVSSWAVANNGWMFCADSTCTSIDFKNTVNSGKFTILCGVRFDGDTTGGWMNKLTGSTGYQGVRTGTDGAGTSRLQCIIENGAAGATASNTANGSWLAGVFAFVACGYDGANNTATLLQGASTVQNATSPDTVGPADSNNEFELVNKSNAITGEIDECAAVGLQINNATLCKLCSCGIANEQGCTCNGATFVGKGRNATACGGCSLSGASCNASTLNN